MSLDMRRFEVWLLAVATLLVFHGYLAALELMDDRAVFQWNRLVYGVYAPPRYFVGARCNCCTLHFSVGIPPPTEA